MRVRDNRGLVIQVTENQIGGLAADAGNFEQLLHRAGHFAVMYF